MAQPRRNISGPPEDCRILDAEVGTRTRLSANKELWAFTGNGIAVRFAYEYHDDSGNWFRAYGNENWEFDESGLMTHRRASINDLPIEESARKYHWDRRGPGPLDHPSLSDLGL
jgi:nuclear transport factor 2 (NTF2) superfamily protein